jgi:hypothetical protein
MNNQHRKGDARHISYSVISPDLILRKLQHFSRIVINSSTVYARSRYRREFSVRRFELIR